MKLGASCKGVLSCAWTCACTFAHVHTRHVDVQIKPDDAFGQQMLRNLQVHCANPVQACKCSHSTIAGGDSTTAFGTHSDIGRVLH